MQIMVGTDVIDSVLLHRLRLNTVGWQKQKLLMILWMVQKTYNKSPTWSLSKSADKFIEFDIQ